MPLELPAVSENILMDNLEVFKRNGFCFNIDPEGMHNSANKLVLSCDLKIRLYFHVFY